MTRARLLVLWVALVVVAAGLSALIPPMQSPDEHSHVFRAHALVHGQWALETPPGESSGVRVDEGLLYFVQPHLWKIVSERAKRLTPQEKQFAHGQQWRGKAHFFPVPGTGYYFPVIYAPHALGIGLGELLDLKVVHSYRLMRLFCIAASAALLVAAFRVLAPPVLAAALLLLPMTTYQLLQPTLDGFTTSLAVLALSLFARRMMEPPGGSARQDWLLAGLLFLLATSRVHLAPMLVLPLFLAWRRRSMRAAVPGLGAIAATLAWTGYALASTVDARIKRAHSTGQLVLQYLQHPWDYVRIVWASLTDERLSTDYSRSFIGVIGWLDTHMALHWYTVLWIGLGLCLAVSLVRAPLRQGADGRAVLLLAGLGSVALAFFALLVTWTPHPARTIEGIQGRYFIVPALALAYATARPAPGARRAWWPVATGAAFGGLALYALIETLLGRYH